MKYDISNVNVDLGQAAIKLDPTSSLMFCFKDGSYETIPLTTDNNLHKIVQHLKYGGLRVTGLFHLTSLVGAAPKVVRLDQDFVWNLLRRALAIVQD